VLFGEGVSMTPLQLGALVAAISNGGTLYYLQHPTSADQVVNFQPRVKRTLDIAKLIPRFRTVCRLPCNMEQPALSVLISISSQSW